MVYHRLKQKLLYRMKEATSEYTNKFKDDLTLITVFSFPVETQIKSFLEQ